MFRRFAGKGIRQCQGRFAFLTMFQPRLSHISVCLSLVCGFGLSALKGFPDKRLQPKHAAWHSAPVSDKEPIPAATKKYPSLLWEVSKPGVKKKSYLYGTMHVSRKLAFRLSDTFFLSLAAADVVALETDPGEWIRYLAEDRLGPFPWTQWMNMAASRDYYSAWSITHPDNKSLEYLIRHEESLADAMLYRRDERQADFSEDTYLDLFIYQAGKKLGKQVTGLEDYRESRWMVARSRGRDRSEEQRDERRPRISRWDASQKLEEAYRSGDLDLIDSLDRIINPGKNYRKWMLTERNRVMAVRMNRIIESGKSLFAGVGAAHLPGDSGMIEMLRRMGYTVRAVNAKSSALARKQKEKIESLEYRHSYSLYTSANGDFEAQMSGMPFQMSFTNGTLRYFLPDPANGAYLLLSSVPYYGAFSAQSQQHVIDRLDSLLFENVRGKILSKSFTTQNGFPAIDVRNRTAQGDDQRLLLVVTPTRIWAIKMAGQGKHVAGKSGELFFSSLRLLEAPGLNNRWKQYEPEAGGYRILWPTAPKFGKSLGDNATYLQGHRDLETVDLNGHYYFLKRIIMHDVDYVEDDTFELSWLARGLAEQFKSELRSIAYVDGFGSRALEATAVSKVRGGRDFTFRLAMHGTAIYAWGTTSVDPDAFLRSFSFTPFRYLQSFETIKDSSLWFITQSLPQPDLLKLQRQLGRDMEDDNDSFEYYKTLNRQFTYSASTGELVNVYTTRYHYFNHEKHIDSIWSRRIKANLENNFSVYKELCSKQGDWETLDLHYTDTASSRVIRAKWYVRGRMSWCVAACYDTLHGPTPFVRAFFEHFQPFDTFTVPTVFATRSDSLLRMMRSGDSATRTASRRWIGYLTLSPSQVPTAIRQIKINDKDRSTMNYRVDLLQALGQVHHPDILPFLKTLYLNAGDTAVLQVAILKALAAQRSEDAARLFAELILEETPLTQDRSDGSETIEALRDSLAVNKSVMPQLLELIRYPDYRSPILDLLCTMVDSNFIRPSDYAIYKKSLTLELRDGWKRLKSDETQDNQNPRMRNNPDAADIYRYSGTRGFYPVESGYPDDPAAGDVLRCARLLLPLLPDASIAHRAQALFSSKDQMFRLLVAEQWLKAGHRIADSIVKEFLDKPMLRWGMLRLMAAYPRLLPMHDSLRNGRQIAESYARFDELGTRDSIKYMMADTILDKGEMEKIYHFKVKSYKAGPQDMGYIYSIRLSCELTDEKIAARPQLLKVRIDGTDLYAQCQQQTHRLLFQNRKRWKRSWPKGDEVDHFADED